MASAQHPGSPGCPQQRLRRQTLISIFRQNCHRRRCHGPEAVRMILTDLCIDLSIRAIMPASITIGYGGISRQQRAIAVQVKSGATLGGWLPVDAAHHGVTFVSLESLRNRVASKKGTLTSAGSARRGQIGVKDQGELLL